MRAGPGEGGQRDALRAIRLARRRRFVEGLDAMEIAYRVYVTLIFGAMGLALVSGVIHDAGVGPGAVDDVGRDGPALLGLLVALAVLAGLRSGARGGPLAIEGAELQYVLLAPVDRGAALRTAALPQLRIAALGGAALGAVAANFAFRRLTGSPVEWFGSLALFGALVPVATIGCALIASGRRLRPSAAAVVGVVFVGWSLADLALGVRTSPATMLGFLATLPLQTGGAAVGAAIGVAAVAAATLAGLASLGGLSLEAARRRAALTAELRFSASVQDLRAVVLLRRQLASEQPRRDPWVRLRTPSLDGLPVWRRDWQSLLRWPVARIGRVVAIGVAAGALAAAAWAGTTPLIALVGVVLLVAALDLVEPLAQEVDHPLLRDLFPVKAESLIGRHLIVPTVGMSVVTTLGAATAVVLGASATAAAVAAVTIVPTALVILCCAAISASTDPYAHILSPVIGYAITGTPIVIAAVAAGAPVIAARESARLGGSAVVVAATIEAAMLGVACGLIIWLGIRISARTAVPA